MININEFAFCYFSSDIDFVIEQEKELTKLSSKYLIERWYRHDRNIGRYTSFSQMVNDAIDDTDSEFMIFCNPKTKFTSEDIEFIIDKLSNGYCFASVVSFGFFGFSKELIRRIGMLDERFINGEWEDDDFSIRLKHFGKASWWGYNYDKYDFTHSRAGNLKHITLSIFNQKYQIQNRDILIDSDLFVHKKISRRHRKFNDIIYNSWLSSDHNGGDGKIADYLKFYNTKLKKYKSTEEVVDFEFRLNRNINSFKIELISNIDMSLQVAFITSVEDNRHITWSEQITNNTWKTFQINYNKNIEIRIFMDDNQIYNNIISQICDFNLNFKLPKIIKV